MGRRSIASRAIPVVCLLVALAGAPIIAQSEDPAGERAMALLVDRSADRGNLAVTAALRVAEAPDGEPLTTLEALVPLDTALEGVSNPTFRVVVVLALIDDEPVVLVDDPPTPDLHGSLDWLYRRQVELPDDLVEAAVVVEELRSRAWGVTITDYSSAPLAAPRRAAMVEAAPPPAAEPSPGAAADPAATVVRIVPPRDSPATGRQRFTTLVSRPDVTRVEFHLDGEAAASDDDPPFAATLDLGKAVRPHTVRAVAFSGGEEVGQDSLTLNAEVRPFRVRISRLEAAAAGGAEVEADVQLPFGGELDRVEIYWNEELAARLEAPPYRARIAGVTPGPQDFVRVVAHLADGSSLEDARLFASPGAAERVEVNLVELYVVVTDREGRPLEDLGRDDFTVTLRGKPQRIERFGEAEEVPLLLGLVIDTSESMWPLMPDTKKAGAQFLSQVLDERDRAFLVDFDTRPRLAHADTGDVVELMRAFARLRADGFTALYDSIIFSLLQFDEVRRRKALVLLTDGDDYKSQFSRWRCIQEGRELGVPVYIIGLGGVQDPRRGLRKVDLEGITEGTGGRIFYIAEMSELAQAYAQIEAELRSQYVLAFTTDEALTPEELGTLKVKVPGRGLTVKTVVDGRQLY